MLLGSPAAKVSKSLFTPRKRGNDDAIRRNVLLGVSRGGALGKD